MVKKKEQELLFITQEEIEEKIKNHLLLLRGAKNLDNDFSGYYFGNWIQGKDTENEKTNNIINTIFENRNLQFSLFSGSIFENGIDSIGYNGAFSFKNSDLEESDFRNIKLGNINFKGAILEGADFRGADYNTNIFSQEQLNNIILTDDDYNKYQEKKKLEEENKKLKTVVKKKNEVIKSTSDKQTNILTQSFEKLEEQFLLEEKRWLLISFMIFFGLFLYLFVPILDIIAFKYMPKILIIILIAIIGLIIGTIIGIFTKGDGYKIKRKEYIKLYKNKKSSLYVKTLKNFKILFKNIGILIFNSFHIFKKVLLDFGIILLFSIFLTNILYLIPEPENSILTGDLKFILLPLGILLSSFLYFSIYQYSKSKKLRIENSNKIALLHGFSAIRSDTGKDMDKGRFYDNVANVVFDKVYPDKEINLPVDKIIDLAKIINK
ncbi:pentapeptide repeat-containing protein [Candidatus Gracilibacteria bacterium 28_42_T64]|nr:pentapeptide repeat-containing protein [Candidatus Gracilibacteria bacterium 28_42_T64]